jgi:hypothetical protein
MQLEVLVHDTPLNTLLVAPSSGLELMDHDVPSHSSTRVCSDPDAPLYSPTAMQTFDTVQ